MSASVDRGSCRPVVIKGDGAWRSCRPVVMSVGGDVGGWCWPVVSAGGDRRRQSPRCKSRPKLLHAEAAASCLHSGAIRIQGQRQHLASLLGTERHRDETKGGGADSGSSANSRWSAGLWRICGHHVDFRSAEVMKDKVAPDNLPPPDGLSTLG